MAACLLVSLGRQIYRLECQLFGLRRAERLHHLLMKGLSEVLRSGKLVVGLNRPDLLRWH